MMAIIETVEQLEQFYNRVEKARALLESVLTGETHEIEGLRPVKASHQVGPDVNLLVLTKPGEKINKEFGGMARMITGGRSTMVTGDLCYTGGAVGFLDEIAGMKGKATGGLLTTELSNQTGIVWEEDFNNGRVYQFMDEVEK